MRMHSTSKKQSSRVYGMSCIVKALDLRSSLAGVCVNISIKMQDSVEKSVVSTEVNLFQSSLWTYLRCGIVVASRWVSYRRLRKSE
jgi:hypothetical protein